MQKSKIINKIESMYKYQTAIALITLIEKVQPYFCPEE